MTHRIFVLLFVSLTMPGVAYGQSWPEFVERLKDRELTLRPTIENRRRVYLPTDADNVEAYVLLRGDRLFPLREPETVQVVRVSAKSDGADVEVRSARLGAGRLEFVGPAPTTALAEQWIDEVFAVTTPHSEFVRYVANRTSRVLHIRGANHVPAPGNREPFRTTAEAEAAGHRLCGVCFLPAPTVSDYPTEHSLALMSLQHVRSSYYPSVDASAHERVTRLGAGILERWPAPLKGYRYRFQVVESDDVNAFAVPTGYIFVTRGLLDALEDDDELSAVLAHEIAHVETRHSYRLWRNLQRVQAITSVLGALAGATSNRTDDLVTLMANFTAGLFVSGFGRDRERESDLFASLSLHASGKDDEPLRRAFLKLKSARDAFDPFRSGSDGPFASHPDIDERLSRTAETRTVPFAPGTEFVGLNRAGELVATLRLDAQRLYQRELEVIATLIATANLGQRDAVNNLTIQSGKGSLRLQESTAESIFPSDEVSVIFKATHDGLLEGPIGGVELRLRNVDKWVPASAPR